MKTTTLPNAPIERILRNAGAKRVSANATFAMRDAMETWAEDIATKAVQICRHAGRKTVQAKDIKLSYKT